MQLSFLSPYKSIQTFPDITLPDFCLVTGLNGSGKKHLLQAIVAKSLSVGGIKPRYGELNIKYVAGGDLAPIQGETSASFLNSYNRNDLFRSVETAKAYLDYREFKNRIARIGGFAGEDPQYVASLPDDEIMKRFGNGEKNPRFALFRQAVSELENNFGDQINQMHRPEIFRLARALGKRVFDLNREDFEERFIPNWGGSELFRQSIGNLFVTYRDLRLENNINRLQNEEDGGSRKVFTAEDFQNRFGPPPWNTLNAAFEAADLNFEISKPSEASLTPYTPQLKKRGTEIVIPFSEVSSGEKVIMAFTFLAFNSSDGRQPSLTPDVLLLDEPDTYLHPSMSKSMLNTIKSVLVDKFQIKVIITTHSPSTVALFEQGSVFKMERGVVGLSKCSKAEALNLLTDGVPTLSLDFSGRRQVFVEDESDAVVYAALFLTFKQDLPAGRSLEFIPTGLRSPSGATVHSGSSIVRHLVGMLEESGNKSVFGLLDWDGQNKQDGRIFVLAEGRRNALENILFDPLLLAALVCRQYPAERSVFGLAGKTWDDFRQLPPQELQEIVEDVGVVIFDEKAGAKVVSVYEGGLQLNVDERWFKMDDHLLTDTILAKLKFLSSIAKPGTGKGAEKLMLSMVDFVIAEQRGFAPIEICQIFSSVLNFDAH